MKPWELVKEIDILWSARSQTFDR